jgi:hypothetical protein
VVAISTVVSPKIQLCCRVSEPLTGFRRSS